MMPLSNLAFRDNRRFERTAVHCRLVATDTARQPIPLLIVDLSEQGLMARTHAPLRVGDLLQVPLPVVGTYWAEVRWALGGRIGCVLDRAIELSDYRGLLEAICQTN